MQMHRNSLIAFIFLSVFLLSLTGCQIDRSQAAAVPTRALTITPQLSSTLAVEVIPIPPPLTDSPLTTQADAAEPAPTATPMPVLVSQSVWAAPDPLQGERLAGARWQADGSLLYALISPDSVRPLRWLRFDLLTRATIEVRPPAADGRALWARLGTSDPARRAGLYPELAGLVSPSGQRAVYPAVVRRHQYDIHPLGRSWLYVVSAEGRWWLLFDHALPGVITHAHWLDENRVLFDALDDTPGIYLANADRYLLTRLNQRLGLTFDQQIDWAVSPDGTRLAVNGLLNGETETRTYLYAIDEPTAPVLLSSLPGGSSLGWTPDGQALVFWQAGALLRHDIQSASETKLIASGALPAEFAGLAGGNYAISPDNRSVAVWDSRYLVVVSNFYP